MHVLHGPFHLPKTATRQITNDGLQGLPSKLGCNIGYLSMKLIITEFLLKIYILTEREAFASLILVMSYLGFCQKALKAISDTI